MISHSYPHPARPGDSRFVHCQVQHLMKQGVSVHVVSPVPYAPPLPGLGGRVQTALAASRAKPRRWELDGVTIDYPRYVKLPGRIDRGLFGPLLYRGIRAHVRRLHETAPFDLVQGQWLVPDGYAAARLGRDLKIPSLSTERGYAARYPDRGPRRRAIQTAIESVDQVVTVSLALARRVNELGRPRRAVRVVYTGVDAEQFTDCDAGAARRALGLPEGRYLVCCARVDEVKQPEFLLEAFAKVHAEWPETRLAWIGEGEQRQELIASADRRGLAGCVHLPGHVPHGEVARWLAAADVVLLASRSEGLPNALVEAGAAARPVVATRVGGIPEVVEEGKTGLLVEPDDVEGFAAAVRQLLRDENQAQTFGQNARRRVTELFSWQRSARQMVDLYEELLAR